MGSKNKKRIQQDIKNTDIQNLDLKNLDLKNLDLKNLDLSKIDLSKIDLSKINNILKDIDKEKLLNAMKNIEINLKKSDNRLEVLNILKEFLPENRRKIVDMFISALGGTINQE